MGTLKGGRGDMGGMMAAVARGYSGGGGAIEDWTMEGSLRIEVTTPASSKLTTYTLRSERTKGFQSMSRGSNKGRLATICGMDHRKRGAVIEGT